MNLLQLGWRPAALAIALSFVLTTEAPAQDSTDQPDRVEVGQEAPLFELESPDGSMLRLESLRGEAPLVLIFFRGTW